MFLPKIDNENKQSETSRRRVFEKQNIGKKMIRVCQRGMENIRHVEKVGEASF